MSHAHHESLPGYHPDQIYIDGCAECEERGANVELAVGNLDERRFAAAWLRAADQIASTPPSGDRGGPRSAAEAPMLHAMWAMQVALERMGVPLGHLPTIITHAAYVVESIDWDDDREARIAILRVPAKVAIR